jgi:hypothetical protein
LTVRRLAEDLQSPTIYQIALSVDRKLPLRTRASVSYMANRQLHMLGTRNINAPVCESLLSVRVLHSDPIPLREMFISTNRSA